MLLYAEMAGMVQLRLSCHQPIFGYGHFYEENAMRLRGDINLEEPNLQRCIKIFAFMERRYGKLDLWRIGGST